MVSRRLQLLREQMKQEGISIYIVPTADFHESEYVGGYFKTREYITGFTGSAGIAVITMTEAGLWTDARYFIQAAKQLEGTEFTLYRMGEENVPTVKEYIGRIRETDTCIGFDARVISADWGRELEKAAQKKGQTIKDIDLFDKIWQERPKLSAEPVSILPVEYAGKTATEKLQEVRECMRKKGTTIHFISTLDDIAWLLNIRGNDIAYVPVVLSYLLITQKEAILFIQEKQITPELVEYLEEHGVKTCAYESIYERISQIAKGEVIWCDLRKMNYSLWKRISNEVKVHTEPTPCASMKAIKNQTEINNLREAHLKDSVAMCKFMFWLKNAICNTPITEISAAKYLEMLRKEQSNFIELSFETISAYAKNGAIVHYAPTPDSNQRLEEKGFLLLDSGGHYLEGTTDITRTFVLGTITEQMKDDFTRVCRANINLAYTRFLYGCTGSNLDIIARMPLWEAGLDYKHGTGHGVGYLLSVHEGPNAFFWKSSKEREAVVLQDGMVTTDEPGIYRENEYGIRIENDLLCRKAKQNKNGQFMEFEILTLVPIDLDGICPEAMSFEERRRLNQYHKMVYKKVSPFLTEEERQWLRQYTREI